MNVSKITIDGVDYEVCTADVTGHRICDQYCDYANECLCSEFDCTLLLGRNGYLKRLTPKKLGEYKVGDVVITYDNKTKFRVNHINKDANEVVLELLEGYTNSFRSNPDGTYSFPFNNLLFKPVKQ